MRPSPPPHIPSPGCHLGIGIRQSAGWMFSELIHSLLSVFMVSVLGASMLTVAD